jgi:hypothetical protein
MAENKTYIRLLAAGLASLALLTGCGSQAFTASASSDAQTAPGTFAIPAKVDIVLAQNDMGSNYEAYGQLAAQFPAFIASLQSSGWDYHFTVIPLTHQATPLQIVASQYDSNWGSQWVAPYPGASENGPETIPASLFSMPSNFGGFQWADSFTSNNSNGSEQGIANILGNLVTLQSTYGTNHLIRGDAMLVVVALSTEEDSSGCTANASSSGNPVDCEEDSTPISTYQQELLALKGGNSSAVQFYAAVANEQDFSENCLGGNSWIGTRYQEMASSLGGQSFDICTGQISGMFSGLTAALQATRLNIETRYLFIASAPNTSTIVVTKYPGGNASAGEVLPNSATNGWTYAGYISAYAIDAPVPMNMSSGYAIELHGSAKLEGSDTANVGYTAAGLQNSAN